ncbi:hypothetical protein mRhiFer1_008202 [Rhinolophus ferrumequinum]|uniref:Uncharacterized protein n=1 Tax=Rhinolophus ferrumequinum TaxID=59479 RepID=A0A7J7W8A6_RHIFE|nr:hypothetical protein mRhiFer1_008202 [Rhinolophus ferrumequinum]
MLNPLPPRAGSVMHLKLVFELEARSSRPGPPAIADAAGPRPRSKPSLPASGLRTDSVSGKAHLLPVSGSSVHAASPSLAQRPVVPGPTGGGGGSGSGGGGGGDGEARRRGCFPAVTRRRARASHFRLWRMALL